MNPAFPAYAYWEDLVDVLGSARWTARDALPDLRRPLALRMELDPDRRAPEKARIEVLGPTGRPTALFRVGDPFTQLASLAERHRSRHDASCVAVTGSNGKSTTCAMLAAVMPGPTIATCDNQNDEIGVPLTILRSREYTASLIVEIGAYETGEISHGCRIVRPDVGVITQIGSNHLERFGSIEKIFATKCEILSPPYGARMGVVPFDDPRFLTIADISHGSVYSFSQASDRADAHLVSVEVEASFMSIEAVVLGEYLSYRLPNRGTHFAVNSLAALLAFCAATRRSAGEACGQLLRSEFPRRRMELSSDSVGRTIIDDSFNASAESVEALAKYLESIAGRKAIVFGGILELGNEQQPINRRALERLRAVCDQVIIYRPISGGAVQFDSKWGTVTATIEECLRVLSSLQVDCIAFKGSRATKVWEIADEYTRRFGLSSR